MANTKVYKPRTQASSFAKGLRLLEINQFKLEKLRFMMNSDNRSAAMNIPVFRQMIASIDRRFSMARSISETAGHPKPGLGEDRCSTAEILVTIERRADCYKRYARAVEAEGYAKAQIQQLQKALEPKKWEAFAHLLVEVK